MEELRDKTSIRKLFITIKRNYMMKLICDTKQENLQKTCLAAMGALT